MRVLVTGASGFIGSHVTAAAVAEGAEVTILAEPSDPLRRLQALLPRLRVVRADLGDVATLELELARHTPQVCLHLAWYTEPGEYLHSMINVPLLTASLGLLQILARVGCSHILATGTCAEYDTSLGYLREDSPTRPATIYAAAKHALHAMGMHLMAAANVGFTWARLFYLYGPGENPQRLVPSVIRALRTGREFPATAGSQVRDYLFVEDVAGALWHLARNRIAGVYNICSGNPVTVRGLLELVAGLLGGEGRVRFGALPDRDWEPKFICGDNTRLLNTGWRAETSLPEGLKRTIAWWSCQADS